MGIVTTLVVLLAVFGAAVDSDSSEQCEHGEVLYEARNQWRGESFCAIDSTHEDTCKYENSFVSFCATDSTHEDTSKVENKNNFVVWINQSHSGTVNSAGFKFNLIINEIDVIICITMATQAKLPPPVYKAGRSYRIYKTELLLWSAATTVPAKQQAAAIVLSLPDDGACRLRTIILERLPLEKLTADKGLEEVIGVLDELLGKDELEECLTDFEEFEDYRRSNEPVNEYIIVFETKYNRVKDKGITLPPEVLAFKLIRGANISAEDRKIVLTGLDYTKKEELFNQGKTALKKFCGKGGKHTSSSVGSADAISVKQEVFASSSGPFRGRYQGRGRGRAPPAPSGRGFWPHQNSSSAVSWRGRGGPSPGNWRGPAAAPSRGSGAPWTAETPKRPVNPPDVTGKPMLCKSCGSYRHFLKDCPDSWEHRKPTHVNFVDEQAHESYMYQPEQPGQYYEYEQEYYQEGLPQDQYYDEQSVAQDTEEPYLTLFTGHDQSHMSNFVAEAQNCAVLDTACGSTVCGVEWFDSYVEQLSDSDTSKMTHVAGKGASTFKFGAGPLIYSLGTYEIPVCLAGKKVMLKTDVVDCEVPLLLSKSAMKSAGIVINMNSDSAIIFGKSVLLNTTSSGHYCVPLKEEFPVCEVTSVISAVSDPPSASDLEKTLMKLHRQFGHPTEMKLVTLLQDAAVWSDDYKGVIKGVYEKCEQSGLCRFKDKIISPVVCLPMAKDFNEKVAIDLKKWDDHWILHMVDMWSRFTVSVFVSRKKPKNIIHAILTDWCSIFGFMETIFSDNGGEFVNAELQEMESILNIEVLTTAANAPHQNGLCERNHQIVDSILGKLIHEYPATPKGVLLKWACMAKNSLQMVEGFSPYQLVIGRNPRLPCVADASPSSLESTTRSETFAQHLNSLHAARQGFIASESCMRIKKALRHRVRVNETVFCPGDKVYYKRDNQDRWLGPAKVIFQDGKVVFVRHGAVWVKVSVNRLVKSGHEFRKQPDATITSSEIQYDTVSSDEEDAIPPVQAHIPVPAVELPGQGHAHVAAPGVPEGVPGKVIAPEVPDGAEDRQAEESASEYEIRRSLRTWNKEHGTQIYCVQPEVPYYVFVSDVPKELHNSSEVISAKQEELQKLDMFGVYECVEDTGQRCIDTRWVVTYKGDGIKARIVARGFQEQQKVAADSPTVAKTAVRSVLAVAASQNWTIKTTDIKSAFLQGRDIDRDIFLKPPKESGEAPGTLWRLKKSLYGLNDGARQFYLSLRHELLALGCMISSVDPSLFIYHLNSKLCGLLISHVDDFLHAGDSSFERLVIQPLARRFVVGRVEVSNFTYIGLDITQRSSSIQISMNSYVTKYQEECKQVVSAGESDRPLNDKEQKEYRAAVGRLNWVAQGTRPDVFFDVIDLSTKLRQATVKDLNRAKKMLIKLLEYDSVVTYPALRDDLRLLVFTDASLGNLSDRVSSTCGILVFLGDSQNNICPLSWRANKIRRVVTSTLAAETLALQEGIKEAIYIQKMLTEILPNLHVPIDAYVDNKSLVDSIMSTKLVDDRMLRLDIGSLKQMMERDIRKIMWIPGERQLADCLTKKGARCDALLGVYHSGKLL